MKTTHLISAALLFWGWQTGWWLLALPMLLLLEAAEWLSWRWDFGEQDFNRLVDLSNLLFIGVSIYLFVEHGSRGVFQIIMWLPAVLYILILSQRFSSAGHIQMSNLFLSLRRAGGTNAELAKRPVNLDIPYLAVCLLAALIQASSSYWVALAMLGFLVAGLYPRRNPRYGLLIWLTCLALAAGLGYLGQQGLRGLHAMVEEATLAWFDSRHWSRRNPYQARTAIGELGRLKLSDNIILRVHADAGKPPGLLRQASYQSYRYGVWRAQQDEFSEVPNRGQENWLLNEQPASVTDSLQITAASRRGRAVLALPGGTQWIRLLLAGTMEKNPLGTVQVREAPEFLQYTSHYSVTADRDQAPLDVDLEVNHPYQALINETAEQLQLHGLPARQVLARLEKYFQENFRYSLIYRPRSRSMPPLNDFLSSSRSGHCEYFATSTVLLLRAAGIPARYATGYSVQEYSGLEEAWLVRRRHAHAWALAYIDGYWEDVDLTPPDWFGEEAAMASGWEPIRDLFSWLSHRIQQWRWQEEEAQANQRLLWLLLPLGLWLGWRLYHQKTSRIDRKDPNQDREAAWQPSIATPFDAIVEHLARTTVARQPGETLQAWLCRIRPGTEDAELHSLLRWHYRMRFDPQGLDSTQLRRFAGRAQAWLQRGANPGAGSAGMTEN